MMLFPMPQPGIFAQGTRSHDFLEFDRRPGVDAAAVRAALARLREPAVTAGGLNIVIGLGRALLSELVPDGTPEDLHDFPELTGAHHAPSTPHDVWIWLHGTGPDLLFDAARVVTAIFDPVAILATEQPCFVYQDSRDITGFVDGTENPPIEDAPEVAIVPEGPGAGGSYVIFQRWVHHLDRFHAQPVEDQEGTIGRTKMASEELDDDVKPPTAHIARVVIEEDGEELEIYRRSVPYGAVGEHGLQFVAFSAELSRFEKMLARMFGLTGDGLHDHLTDFTTPVTGAFYFAPNLHTIRSFG